MRAGLALAVLLAGLAPGLQGQARRVILDTDLGDYDDLVTIMLAATSPEIDLLGVVVTGTRVESGARTVARALDLMGRPELPIFRGDSAPGPRSGFNYWGQFPRRRWALMPRLEQWARDYPLRLSPTRGSRFYLDAVTRYPGQVTIVVIGPLTSVAAAIRLADSTGKGEEFRRGIGQLNISGGDFGTVEYNVWADQSASRLVYDSGIPSWQFGGEGGGKAFLTHDRRERLWKVATPATWALQDYYRLYEAGYDPTAPFIPILYDVFALAQLLPGPAVCEYDTLAVRVDSVGHLVRVAGPATTHSRTINHADRLLDLVERRLSDPLPAATNHLRTARSALGLADTTMPATREGVLDAVTALAAATVDSSEAARSAREHLLLARKFLVGDPRPGAWTDPYSPLYVFFYTTYLVLPKKLLAGATLLVGALAVWLVRRRQRTLDVR